MEKLKIYKKEIERSHEYTNDIRPGRIFTIEINDIEMPVLVTSVKDIVSSGYNETRFAFPSIQANFIEEKDGYMYVSNLSIEHTALWRKVILSDKNSKNEKRILKKFIKQYNKNLEKRVKSAREQICETINNDESILYGSDDILEGYDLILLEDNMMKFNTLHVIARDHENNDKLTLHYVAEK